MIKASVTVDDVLVLLNVTHAADPKAMDALVKARVSCNEELANHPTVQVGLRNGSYSIGILGILNGLFGIDGKGYGAIAANYDSDKLVGFVKL
jgi:hypothetical protein